MSDLSTAVAALDVERTAFLRALDALTPAQRAAHPADGAWSADDVAEHLMRTERGMVRGIERQVAAADARRDVGEPSEEALVRLLTRLTEDDTLRYPMPESAAPYIAPSGLDPADVRAEWDALAAHIHHLADAFPPELAAVGLTRHPLIGGMTAAGTIRFVAAHIVHHRRQLDRIAASEPVRTAGGS